MASEIEDERKYLLQLSMDEQVEDVRLAHEKFYCMLIHILFPCRNYAPTAPAPSPGVRTVVLYQGEMQVDSYTVYDAVDEYIGTPDKYYQREYIPECSPK
ncbi:hypothetical protein [Chitinophaga agri]|uniref:Uncharacterized protein n=1 Tax=Chitinophaga agri TaxID=2703787 RepID=A0A6B9ZHQ7_9BACT|nr:hypothetical protein [Chitinophaga agri]QHS60864.1 hypothetical protein GWR21_15060 [Chitinophaga agri]